MLLAAGVCLTACNDDDDVAISTTPIVSEITTGDAIVNAVSAQIPNGTIKDLSHSASSSYEVGVVYSTSADPTTDGTMVKGSFSNDTVNTTLNGLTTGTTYHYATYVCLQGRVYKYGEVKEFTATNATVTNNEATGVSYTKATFSADFTGLNGLSNVQTGVKISSDPDKLLDSRDYEITTVGGLLPGHTYYYTTFAKVGSGYVLGETRQLTTLQQTMEYVDLGLSVTWAKYNLGAEEEEGIGTYFGYGDTTGENYSTNVSSYPSENISDTEFDITNGVNIDGDFPFYSAMPTLDQVKELISNTTKSVETVNGVKGIRFTGANGNSIFLPYTGYRNGKDVINNGDQASYWTGSISAVNNEYASTLNLNGNVVSNGNSLRSLGLPLRTVRPYSVLTPSAEDQQKLNVGDLESNGRIRIEIYNEYGSTKDNPIIDPNSIKFSKTMAVTFKISGLNDNYKEGAAKSNIAGLEFNEAKWGPASHWSSLDGDKYDANVTGDGTYTVWMETNSTANGAVVFCIDIKDLASDLVDASKVKAEIVSIALDDDPKVGMDFSHTEFNNYGSADDGRIEIYNEYGNTKGAGADASALHFYGNLIVNFTINGIDGNLKDGAAGSYSTNMCYAAAGTWDPSYWGGSSFGNATITGDGSYTVFATMNKEASGAVVWTVESHGLYKDLVDPAKVSVTINSVETPGKIH